MADYETRDIGIKVIGLWLLSTVALLAPIIFAIIRRSAT